MAERARFIAGRYRLLDLIGSGGMGRVWLAWDERLSRAVAVKQLRSPVELPEAEARLATDRAIREGRITARLHHPHAVPIFDVVDHEGLPCLVMQYLPSRSLHEIVSSEGALPPREAARIGSEVASALEAAHEAGIVHRDVKPANILIADGTARITDFGISRVLGDVTLSATGMVTGTPAFLAPEVARGAGATTASDVFSLGATLYAAVEGGSPFGEADNPMAVLHRAASGAVTPPTQAGPLSPMLLRMLATAPDERPTMHEAALELAKVAGGGSPDEAPVTSRVVPPRPMARERTVPGVAVPAVVAGAHPAGAHQARANPAPARPTEPPETQRVDRRTAVLPAAVRPGPDGRSPALPRTVLPASEDPDREPRRRRRALPLLVALLLVASALFAVWAVVRTGGGPGEAGSVPPRTASSAPEPTRPTSSPSVSTPPRTSAPARTTPARPTRPTPQATRVPRTSAPAPDDGTTTAADLVTAVRDYYRLLPGGTDAGWLLLTDRYRATTAGSRAQYQGFWDGIRAVRVSSLAGDAPAYVVATVTYEMDDGRTIVERTSYSLVEDDGVLKIDRSSVISSRQV